MEPYVSQQALPDDGLQQFATRNCEDSCKTDRSFASAHQVWQTSRNLIGHPRLSIAVVDTELTMMQRKESGEIYHDIEQPIGEEEVLENAGSQFLRHGAAVAPGMQESGTCDEDVEIDRSTSLPYGLLASEDTTHLASYLHCRAEEIRKRFLGYSSLRHPRKPSICCRTQPLLIEEEEESASPRRSKVDSGSSNAQLSSMPICLGTGRTSDSDANPKESSKTSVNEKSRSIIETGTSDEISDIGAQTCSTAASADFHELNDDRYNKNLVNDLHASQVEGDNSDLKDVGFFGDGHPTGFAVQKRSSSRRRSSSSRRFVADVPQQTFMGQTRYQAQNRRDDSLQLIPTSISCVDSSECDNFGAEIATSIAANEPRLRKAGSRHCSQEIDSMSEAGDVEECKQEKMVLNTVGNDPAEAPIDVKSEDRGALDLLLTAIQLTSGDKFEDENDETPSVGIESVSGRGDDDHLHSDSKGLYFVYGRSPIVKKKVIRRARSAFKKPQFVPEVSLGRRKSENQRTEIDSNAHVSQLSNGNDGDRMPRLKRGRSQVLPTRFSDSVLQPWKRKTRRKLNGNFRIQ